MVLVHILALNDDDSLAVEHKGHGTLGAHIAAGLIKVMANLTGGAVAVVGQGLYHHSHAAGTVALIHDLFIVGGVRLAGRLLEHTINIVAGHIILLGLGDNVL